MAILKVGDYVLVGEEKGGDKLGRITQLNFHPMYHLVWLMDSSMPMAILKHQQYLIPIDPAFGKLLTDVHKKEVSND